MKDSELVERFRKKYDWNNDYKIIYTDDSVQKDKMNTGIGIVTDESDVAYQISINSKCTIYTVEALAIEKAMGYVQENDIDTDILILSDSQSVCKALNNNNIIRY